MLFRGYTSGSTYWFVDSSDRLNDCGEYGWPFYFHSASNPGPLGDAPTATEYNNGDGWYDYNNGAHGTITVTAYHPGDGRH